MYNELLYEKALKLCYRGAIKPCKFERVVNLCYMCYTGYLRRNKAAMPTIDSIIAEM